MDPVTSARKHQFGSVSTPPSSRHHHESRKKPTSTCTSPSTSGKSLSLTSAWLVRSPATSPRDAAGSSASRRHKRSGSQSGHDLLKKILPPPEDAFDHSPAAKSGGQSDVGAKEEKLKRVVRRLHLRLTPRSSSGTTAGSETLGELRPKTSEVPTSNLAVVTSARESGDTNSKSTKREREDEDEDEDQSRTEAKRARRETSTSGRKGILKNLKKERASNHKRSVRWAERLEDYNYPNPDPSDQSLTPPSPAHDGVNKSPDENVNVVITDDECSEGGLSAEGSLFPGGPNTTGQLLEEGANPEPPFSSKRSSLNNGDCGEDTPSSTSEECSANGCSREKQYRTAARRRIGFSASREMAVKDGRDDGTEKFAGFEGTSGPASPLT
ncbi:hypothetical protein FS837_003217 [Tulasnella sp. UAMH 9824]|nr:hypothetical protein FS837_003217 [Tulasnella sp. UAMH 9824]